MCHSILTLAPFNETPACRPSAISEIEELAPRKGHFPKLLLLITILYPRFSPFFPLFVESFSLFPPFPYPLYLPIVKLQSDLFEEEKERERERKCLFQRTISPRLAPPSSINHRYKSGQVTRRPPSKLTSQAGW